MFKPFWEKSDKIVVGVSGGIDSMVLAHLLLQKVNKAQLIIAHVNHFMRETASHDQQFVVNWAIKNGVTVETNDTAPPIDNEEQARTFRYQFFKTIVQKYNAQYVVTAHHKEDNAETVLMTLIRTGSAHSVLGIAPQQPFIEQCQLVRPLLAVSKKAIVRYAKEHAIHYVDDETNDSDNYTRNRIRHHIMPYLQQENTNVVDHLVTFSHDVEQLNDFVNTHVNTIFNRCIVNHQLIIAQLCQEQPVIQRKVLAKWLHQHHCLTHHNVEQLHQVILKHNGFKQLDLGNKKWCMKQYDRLTISENMPYSLETFKPMQLSVNDKTVVTSDDECWGVKISDIIEANSCMVIPLMPNELPLCIRPQLAGDIIAIKNGHKKISRVFIDAKVPKNKRENIPLLVTNDNKVIGILKSGLEYLSKYKETGKITHDSNYYVVVERERNNDS